MPSEHITRTIFTLRGYRIILDHVELDYWLRKNATADVWVAFAEEVRSGAYTLWPADASIVLAAAQLQSKLVDQGLGFVDAAVFCSCEALGERKVATLDQRHFGVLRGADGQRSSCCRLNVGVSIKRDLLRRRRRAICPRATRRSRWASCAIPTGCFSC